MSIAFAVIGGTGLYALEELGAARQERIGTRYGDPSGPITIGAWHGRRVAFLARHGEQHRIAPHRVNYRANIDALRQLGVTRVVAINAVGGITERFPPRALGVPDQLIDYTHGRVSSFSDFEGDKVAHIDFSEPYSADLRRALLAAGRRSGVALVDGGVYAATQGPRLETRAEIARLRRDGCDLVGMTGMPEAALAREAGVEYACLAVVANWAAGCGDAAEISLDEIYAHLAEGMQQVRRVLAAYAAELPV